MTSSQRVKIMSVIATLSSIFSSFLLLHLYFFFFLTLSCSSCTLQKEYSPRQERKQKKKRKKHSTQTWQQKSFMLCAVPFVSPQKAHLSHSESAYCFVEGIKDCIVLTVDSQKVNTVFSAVIVSKLCALTEAVL